MPGEFEKVKICKTRSGRRLDRCRNQKVCRVPTGRFAEEEKCSKTAGKTRSGKWTRETLRIDTGAGKIDVKGYSLHPLGVHNGLKPGETGWCISHLPSGLRMTGFFDTAKDAKAAAEIIVKEFGVEWLSKSSDEIARNARKFSALGRKCLELARPSE